MAKQLILSVLTLLFSTIGFTQYILTTPDGKTVQLKENGTWHFIENTTKGSRSTNIPAASTKKYISKNNKYVIWFDPDQWLCDTTKTTKGYWWDATFNSPDYSITGYFLESRLAMPVNNLEAYIKTEFAEQGTVKSFSNFKDTVNGLPFSCFDMVLEWNGLLYQYRGYIYSELKGSLQFIIGTQNEIFAEDKEKIATIFKGITKY